MILSDYINLLAPLQSFSSAPGSFFLEEFPSFPGKLFACYFANTKISHCIQGHTGCVPLSSSILLRSACFESLRKQFPAGRPRRDFFETDSGVPGRPFLSCMCESAILKLPVHISIRKFWHKHFNNIWAQKHLSK